MIIANYAYNFFFGTSLLSHLLKYSSKEFGILSSPTTRVYSGVPSSELCRWWYVRCGAGLGLEVENICVWEGQQTQQLTLEVNTEITLTPPALLIKSYWRKKTLSNGSEIQEYIYCFQSLSYKTQFKKSLDRTLIE